MPSAGDAIERVIVPRTSRPRRLLVRRALPSSQRRMVGPFIFFDHMGPAEFRAGQGIDVRPHPHIGLATVPSCSTARSCIATAWAVSRRFIRATSTGCPPGAASRIPSAPRRTIGWRRAPAWLAVWLAMPAATKRSRRPSCTTIRRTFPSWPAKARSCGSSSAASTASARRCRPLSDTIFADAALTPGAVLPIDAQAQERALYVVAGEIDIAGDRFAAGRLLVLRPGDPMSVTAASEARVILVGGAAMDGPRHIWWNFVSSRKERIEQAKADWKLGRFDTVPGDEREFIPLPE